MPGNFYDVKADFGAVGNGSTDDYAAINSALNNTPQGAIIFFPPGRYRTSATVTLSGGRAIEGLSSGSDVSQQYSELVGDANISVVLLVQGGGGSQQSSVRRFGIGRASQGPQNSIGLQFSSTNYGVAEDVYCHRHDVCVQVSGTVATYFNRLNTASAGTSHVRISDSSVQTSFTDCAFGRNGGVDLNCANLIHMDGNGWDTTRFNQCQFNQGQNSVTDCIWVSGYNNPSGILSVVNSHAEAFNRAFLTIDDSTTLLQRIILIGNTISTGDNGQNLISQTGGKISDVFISSNVLDVILSADRAHRGTITGNIVSRECYFNQGTLAITGNIFEGTVNLQGASPNAVVYAGNITGTLNNTGGGNMQIGLNAPYQG